MQNAASEGGRLRSDVVGLLGAATLGTVMLSPAMTLYANFGAASGTAGRATPLAFVWGGCGLVLRVARGHRLLLFGAFIIAGTFCLTYALPDEQPRQIAAAGGLPIADIARVFWGKGALLVTLTGISAALGIAIAKVMDRLHLVERPEL